MTRPNTFMVFDVESAGLHGEGFAVGWVVAVLGQGLGQGVVDEGIACCPLGAADGGSVGDRRWVEAHVVPHLPHPYCETPVEVRRRFWFAWQQWRSAGAILAADVAWPVEARFLCDCVRDFGGAVAPYPLVDVASVILAAGGNPIGTHPRLESEHPPHNPLNDARQSARLLSETLDKLRAWDDLYHGRTEG